MASKDRGASTYRGSRPETLVGPGRIWGARLQGPEAHPAPRRFLRHVIATGSLQEACRDGEGGEARAVYTVYAVHAPDESSYMKDDA